MYANGFCRVCGVRQEPDSRFCNACGADVAASLRPAEAPRDAVALPQYQKHGSAQTGQQTLDHSLGQEGITRMSKGLRVSAVKQGSQAEQLGIKIGDHFVSYNGLPVSSNIELSTAASVAKNEKLESISICLLRGGSEFTCKASLEPLGLNCEEINEGNQLSSDELSYNYKTQYGLARSILPFVSFLGWVLLIIGISVSIFALFKGMSSGVDKLLLAAILPGIGGVVMGAFTIMISQIALATSDSADQSREILKLLDKKSN